MKMLKVNGQLTVAAKRKFDSLVAYYSETPFADMSVPGLMRCDDAVEGDVIVWFEPVFSGRYRGAKLVGYQWFAGRVVSESYGAKRQQHTFTIRTLDGATLRKKGRTIYKNCFWLRRNNDQSVRDDKHMRGAQAREKRGVSILDPNW